jgi:hypothetical protein
MIRWIYRYPRLILTLGALAALLVASGAGTKWA